ncbi:metalloregulator ArsR/SmtB family transcription factor [Gordonia sp. LSe1-13]|uniref:Metalloregulator ArsR/SmtB family transcription factor n=2 Tax=Gordonia TaxID=2053 RepID=A0ABU7MC35_9ACTN|nr:metalloregulator ArsR/SmtB family transcription factor [Gordonia sp. LSe1-13]MEE4022999.1 metalloregulator ArsR/SmtB family transcription factor [Gordonia sp. PKS22-38]
MRSDTALPSGAHAGPSDGGVAAAGHHDGQTRAAVVSLLVEDGPLTATEIADRLGISAAGVRRHLDALAEIGDVETSSSGFGRRGQRGRGRPAKWFQLTATGRGKMRHAYDDLAGAAMRKLRAVGGEAAVEEFARDRVEEIVADVTPAQDPASVADTVNEIADALTSAGFSANTREVGTGMQICQHHCPVAHVAAEFPELCEAETAVFTELLGTHVQRLATIANGDCACTTHVPLHPPPSGTQSPSGLTLTITGDAQPASAATKKTSRKASR